MPDRYMMATRATHKTGDLSREQPNLAVIDREEDDAYVGAWATGVGFIEVRFPKDTTRPLTADERAFYGARVIECAGNITPIRVDES